MDGLCKWINKYPIEHKMLLMFWYMSYPKCRYDNITTSLMTLLYLRAPIKLYITAVTHDSQL